MADRRVDRGREELSAIVEAVVAVTPRPKPVHAIEETPSRLQVIQSKFWDHAYDSGDDTNDMASTSSLSTPTFIKEAHEAGFTTDELARVE